MGINLTSQFSPKVPLPIDDRMIVADVTARDAIVSGVRYNGMSVTVLSPFKNWQLQGGITNSDWVDTSGGGGTSFDVDTILTAEGEVLVDDEGNVLVSN